MDKSECGCGGIPCGSEDAVDVEKVVDLEAPDVELAAEGVAEFVRYIDGLGDDEPVGNRGAAIKAILEPLRRHVEGSRGVAALDAAFATPATAEKAVRVYQSLFKVLIASAAGVAIAAGFDPATATLEILSELAGIGKAGEEPAEEKAAG